MNELRTALLTVGLEEQDRQTLARAASGFDCDVIGARTIQEAIQLIQGRVVPVIVCRRTFPDGSWRDLLNSSAVWKSGARIIVVSRLADNRLWAEVLNFGAYDLLVAPLDEREILRVLGSACHDLYGAESTRLEATLAVPCL